MQHASDNDLPPLSDLDPLDLERAADMLDNRPLYGPDGAACCGPRPKEDGHSFPCTPLDGVPL